MYIYAKVTQADVREKMVFEKSSFSRKNISSRKTVGRRKSRPKSKFRSAVL